MTLGEDFEVKSELIEVEAYKRELFVEIPSSSVKEQIEDVIKKLQKKAKVPGFRLGKAPPAVIKSRYSHLIKEEVINKLIPQYYKKAIEKHNLRPLHPPMVEDLHFKEGEPLKFKARFEVEPEIKINDYIGIKVKEPELKLEDKELDAALRELQERAAEMVSIEDRAARQGDYLIMDINWKIEATKGKPIFQKDAQIILGSNDNLPQLNEELKGLSIGEEKEFRLQYPEEWSVKYLAGKKVYYQVKLNEIKEKRLPLIDDNFAKDLGDFANLAELKEKMVKDLTEQKKQKIAAQVKDAILKKIIEKNPLQVPEIWLQQELDARSRQLIQGLIQQGVDPQAINLDLQRFRQEIRAEALEAVKKSTVLKVIAEQEGLEISNEEVNNEIEKIAKGSGQSLAVVRKYLSQENRMEALKDEILLDKALDFLRINAIILNDGK